MKILFLICGQPHPFANVVILKTAGGSHISQLSDPNILRTPAQYIPLSLLIYFCNNNSTFSENAKCIFINGSIQQQLLSVVRLLWYSLISALPASGFTSGYHRIRS